MNRKTLLLVELRRLYEQSRRAAGPNSLKLIERAIDHLEQEIAIIMSVEGKAQ